MCDQYIHHSLRAARCKWQPVHTSVRHSLAHAHVHRPIHTRAPVTRQNNHEPGKTKQNARKSGHPAVSHCAQNLRYVYRDQVNSINKTTNFSAHTRSAWKNQNGGSEETPVENSSIPRMERYSVSIRAWYKTRPSRSTVTVCIQFSVSRMLRYHSISNSLTFVLDPDRIRKFSRTHSLTHICLTRRAQAPVRR